MNLGSACTKVPKTLGELLWTLEMCAPLPVSQNTYPRIQEIEEKKIMISNPTWIMVA